MKGIKFEMFIFDALGLAERSVTLEVPREEEFAPVKNKTGTDSPETAQRAMIRVWTQWLGSSWNMSAVPDDLIIEVSPLYALDEIEFKKKFIPPEKLSSPLYLG